MSETPQTEPGETPPSEPAQPPAESPLVQPAPRKSRVGAILVLIIVMVAALGAVWFYRFNTSMPVLTIYPSQRLTSADWCGYAASTDLISPKGEVTAVSAQWVVPTVTSSTSDSFSAAWVGIGGQYDETLIQTGTEHVWANNTASYDAWYELLPYDSVQLTMSVSPGDTMSASITLQNSASNLWLIEIKDLSNGQSFSQSFSYASSRLSADWVMERPTVNNILYPLADFGRVSFTGCSATIGGRTGGITGFPNTHVDMNGRMNNFLTSVSDPSNGGASFTVDFVANR